MPSDYAMKRRAAKVTPAAQVVSVVKAVMGRLDRPDPGRIWGIDTSTHVEGIPDWAVAKAKGCRFADIKVINGIVEVPRWRESSARAKAAGLPRLFYGWVYPSIPGRSAGGQARKFAEITQDDPPELGYQADFEWTHGGNPTFRDLYGYVGPLEAATGRIPSIYTGAFWEEAEEGDWEDEPIVGRLNEHWKRYLLHIAHYGTNNPRIPCPWDKAGFHQWTEDGDGVEFGFNKYDARRIDLNYFLGTEEEFVAMGGAPQGSPLPDSPDEEPPIVVVPPSDELPIADEAWYGGKVRYQRFRGPHGADYHVLRIRTQDIADVVFDPRYNLASTTNWLKARPTLHLAINGLDQFGGGKLAGFAAYHGQISFGQGSEETLYVSRDLTFSLSKPRSVWTACSFPNLLIKDGVLQKAATYNPREYRARTALGITKDQSEIVILVADGKDYADGIGMDFLETAVLLQKHGAWLGMMGDGGGSTTGAIRCVDGVVRLFNKPSGENPPDAEGNRQRSVAQHMGIRLKETS